MGQSITCLVAASDKFLRVQRQFWTSLWLGSVRWSPRACIPPGHMETDWGEKKGIITYAVWTNHLTFQNTRSVFITVVVIICALEMRHKKKKNPSHMNTRCMYRDIRALEWDQTYQLLQWQACYWSRLTELWERGLWSTTVSHRCKSSWCWPTPGVLRWPRLSTTQEEIKPKWKGLD